MALIISIFCKLCRSTASCLLNVESPVVQASSSYLIPRGISASKIYQKLISIMKEWSWDCYPMWTRRTLQVLPNWLLPVLILVVFQIAATFDEDLSLGKNTSCFISEDLTLISVSDKLWRFWFQLVISCRFLYTVGGISIHSSELMDVTSSCQLVVRASTLHSTENIETSLCLYICFFISIKV